MFKLQFYQYQYQIFLGILKLEQRKIAIMSFTRKKIQTYSYGLNDVIGKGYSSQVYKGRNDQTDHPVAVKVIDLKMLKNQINRVLLESEIQILKEIKNQPNVLFLHDVYTTKNNTYIISQLCQSDLNKVIKKKLTQNEVYSYMAQIINGYLSFYSKQIIHRDLKPANILVTDKNELKIADFGFGIKATELTKPSKYNVGSPLYMAPESLKKNQYSYKSDIWAIGVIYFQMLTGQTPWKAKNQKQLIKKIQNQKIEDITSKLKISALSKQFLKKTLKVDKNLRLDPQDLDQYQFIAKVQQVNVLMQKKLNFSVQTTRQVSNNNILHTLLMTSPKGNNRDCSVQNRLKSKDYSDKKFNTFKLDSTNQSTQFKNTINKTTSPVLNIQLKKKESNQNKYYNPETTYTKENQNLDTTSNKKSISKILISEVHFCRFLFKLLTRIMESINEGVLHVEGKAQRQALMLDYTGVIKHKIEKLLQFKDVNFIKIANYEEYKSSSDYVKLMKIAREYSNRYCLELSQYWKESTCSFSIASTNQLMAVFYHSLQAKYQQMVLPHQEIRYFAKDVIILDYLMTARQLIDMLQDGENYQKFAKKSRIEEIVEGKTTDINIQLFQKIMKRAEQLLFTAKDQPISPQTGRQNRVLAEMIGV